MAIVREVEYEADGLVMRGRLAHPEGTGLYPAVVIAPEAQGLDEFQAHRADVFCELGYAALAMDYYGDGTIVSDHDDVARRRGLGQRPRRDS